ncbi:Vacuolar protein sorting-associated protein 54, chloroplastic [Tolypocladium ophioglossoides CBS 100239]|uniref:Vacuolar protein sorting-associated protein 54, chloroplastic n=1 Tax=Tolypocladium ophioglossoides (strain CBS 100239) TaxID=1163406 RepID=A0A0L0NEU6_TOLOC|nr:Vacuolar protein sorting-associated protein 54, chloroplastic [Tolypocladium ophioglossoides CBS 100239]
MYPHGDGCQSMDTSSPISSITRSGSSLKHDRIHAAPRPRRGSTASSTHSIRGHLLVSTSSWSATGFELGQNAISTLLQPPIVRTRLQPHTFAPASSLQKTPTVRDIPPVSLTNIKIVDAAEFKPYISQVGALYEQLQRVRDSEGEERARRESKSDSPFRCYEDSRKADGQSHLTRKGSVASMTSVTTQNERLSRSRGSGSYSRKGHCGPPPLSTIPDIYFDEDFHLENPRTFDVVSERSGVVPPTSTKEARKGNAPAPRKALATNAILQEKLSWYMDMVEVHLINSISIATTTFFSALGSLRELHSEAAESVEKIQILRKDLASLDEDVVMKGLQLLQKRQKSHNLQQMSDAVLQLKRIVDGVAYCELLVDEGEVEKALAEIDAIELLMAGERDETLGDETSTHFQLRDVRGATALQGLASDLTILRFRIGKVFESKVHNVLIGDLRRHAQSVSTREVLLRWEAASLRAKGGHAQEFSAFPAYMGMTDELRTALLPNISGLHRSGSISTAIQAYRESVLREIRNIVRKPLPSSTEDGESVISGSTISGGPSRTNQEKSSILARNIRALDAEDAETLFSTIYIGVTETLRRLKTQSGLLLEVACAIGNPDAEDSVKFPVIRSPIGSPNPAGNTSIFEIQEEMHAALDLLDLLGQAVDVSHEKINKILRVRSEQVKGLPLAHFLRYFTLNLLFANECEAISGRAGTSLKTAVDGHIEDFIKAHRDREIQTLAQGMGADNWQDADFTAKHNEILKQILECSTSDPPVWTEMSKPSAPLSQEVEEIDGIEVTETNSTAKDKVRGATIEDETFLLPYSAILCFEGVSHFLHLMGSIPSMTPDIAMSLVSYLQIFDSRSRQLILGAGALRSAGLKNITTKHLALTSQALTFIATLIPHIREFVQRHAPAGPVGANLMSEFDKIRRALQEHQDSIYQKMVEIMESRARMLSKKAREAEWDNESAEDVRRYMVDLTTDTGRLNKALSKYLPEQAVALVMVQVFTSYKDQLGKAFKEAEPKTETGRDCMLRDVEHLVGKLGKIEGFGDLGTHLMKMIEGKEIKTTSPTDSVPVPMKVAKGGEGKINENTEPPAEK